MSDNMDYKYNVLNERSHKSPSMNIRKLEYVSMSRKDRLALQGQSNYENPTQWLFIDDGSGNLLIYVCDKDGISYDPCIFPYIEKPSAYWDKYMDDSDDSIVK